MILEINHLEKVYRTRFSKEETRALQDVDFKVEEGEFIAIMGESGSGKTTLLNILATLDKPTRGSVILNNQDITKIKESKLADFRLRNLGFVFQDFNLLDTLSTQDNIFLPLVLARESYEEMEKRLKVLAPKLRIKDLLKKRPFELSGGQKQRVAIARSLITQPQIVLADEPTAALDYRNSEDLLNLFEDINLDGQTILMVTHSANAASHAKRVLFIKDGRIFHQLYKDGEFIGYLMQKTDFNNMIMGFTGGLLFTGFLLGISFLLGAALIIYYKQYSEGHEDKKSYKILQEVGMSQQTVKKTIDSQTLLVFFMPLAMATLHFVVALVMLKQMLMMFGVVSSSMIYTISGITLLAVALIYFVIYKWTSRTYYRIIER